MRVLEDLHDYWFLGLQNQSWKNAEKNWEREERWKRSGSYKLWASYSLVNIEWDKLEKNVLGAENDLWCKINSKSDLNVNFS